MSPMSVAPQGAMLGASAPPLVLVQMFSFAVPPVPGATFFNQAFALDPGANALGLTTSNGGRGVIGM